MIIAPSVLSIDYLRIKEQMQEVNESKAEWIHYDVMDGHFVPNMTFGPDFIKALQGCTDLVSDIHLMVNEPLRVAEYFLVNKPDYLTCHYEACDDLDAFVTFCQANGIKPGLSIKPNTPIKEVEDIIDKFSLILVMSVEPGFGNQKFMPEALEKIAYLAKRPHDYLIQVDGGINAETAKLCIDAGCDVLVAGSYIFKGPIKERVESLLWMQ